MTRETRLTEPVNGEGPSVRVAALSEALAALAREITTGLRQVRVPARTRDRTQ